MTAPDSPDTKPDSLEIIPARRAPPVAELTTLSDDTRDMITLMVFGLDDGGEVDGETFEPGEPLPLKAAARAIGLRVRRARELATTDLFQAELNRQVEAARRAERANNLRVAKKIRDEEGDRSAATKTARLKAAQFIEGRPSPAPAVNVTVNNGCDQRQVRAGYIIRLGPSRTDDTPSNND